MKDFNIPDLFYVVAVDTERVDEGETVFFAIDQHSGGYPYWTRHHRSAASYDSLVTAERAYKEATSASFMIKPTISRVRIVQSVTTLNIVDEFQIKQQKIENALAKLDDDEKELLGLKEAK